MSDSAQVVPLNSETPIVQPQGKEGCLRKTCCVKLSLPVWALYVTLAVLCSIFVVWVISQKNGQKNGPQALRGSTTPPAPILPAPISVLAAQKWYGQDLGGEEKFKAANIQLTTSDDIADEEVKDALLNLGPAVSSEALVKLDAFIKEKQIDLVTFGMAEWRIEPMVQLKAKGWPLSVLMTSQGMENEADLVRVVDKEHFQQTLKETGLEDYTIPNYDPDSLLSCNQMSNTDTPDAVPDRCTLNEAGRSAVSYPIMVKPANGMGGAHKEKLYKKVDSEEQLLDFFNRPIEYGTGSYTFLNPSDFTLQEWVMSKYEDSFHFVYSDDHGGFLQMKITRDEYNTENAVAHHKPERKRSTLEHDSIPPAMIANFEKLLRKVHYRGLGCFDIKYKKSDLDKPMVMEMNPRLCASMSFFDDYGAWFRTWAGLYLVGR
uniref:ATP-grasp domain-containing protein n=1 Tax=Chromera velia CCMP2878 TaxID=1169474 RepID=A0A0G4F5I0_9ALVE|eukprot:Cvel_15346.t1-p1 / transcript=Cvel_15346.t1 / gene=Cvel_15346 / organism=Chromera_velia_CCMP2878 / gene_product=hypothetical protein / transcript_product=hypothetical protein / location=Cvel_scaffold1129:46959-48248(-) / protein_length=430 / sequence_SO=supercontig / SO=protein_coding / is_pseudo=false